MCLQALEEIMLLPKNTTNPPVDLLSSGQPAQSTSEKAFTRVELERTNFNHREEVYLRYLRIILTDVLCRLVGVCKNVKILLTKKYISGFVKVRVESSHPRALPSDADNFSEVESSMVTGLQPCISNCFNKYVIYFS